MGLKVIVLKNKKEISKKVSEMIIKDIKNNNKLNLGLSTGKTMIPVYYFFR